MVRPLLEHETQFGHREGYGWSHHRHHRP